MSARARVGMHHGWAMGWFAAMGSVGLLIAPKAGAKHPDNFPSAIVRNPAEPFARVEDPSSHALLYRVFRETGPGPAPSQHLLSDLFKDPEGKPAVKVAVVTDADGGVVNYTLDEYQTGEKGRIWVEGGKIRFEYRDAEGKTKKSEENLDGVFAVGLTLRDVMLKHWPELMAKKDVRIRYGVVERRETVGFKLFKDREEKQGKRDVVVIEMKPTSPFIAAIVNPLYFTFDKTTYELLSYEGRTLPKRMDDGKYKYLDALTVYAD